MWPFTLALIHHWLNAWLVKFIFVEPLRAPISPSLLPIFPGDYETSLWDLRLATACNKPQVFQQTHEDYVYDASTNT